MPTESATVDGLEDYLALYDRSYAPKLLHRANTMRAAFAGLLAKRSAGFYIVETGCASKFEDDGIVYGPQTAPDHPWYPGGWEGPWSAGLSTILFDRFVQRHGGRVFSVDLDPQRCQAADARTSLLTTVTCGDSVQFLHGIDRMVRPELIDLLYLDSVDCDWDAPHPSSLHHLKELAAVFARLAPGCLILVDDCQDAAGRRGKGLYIEDFMLGLGYEPLLYEYQTLWQK